MATVTLSPIRLDTSTPNRNCAERRRSQAAVFSQYAVETRNVAAGCADRTPSERVGHHTKIDIAASLALSAGSRATPDSQQ